MENVPTHPLLKSPKSCLRLLPIISKLINRWCSIRKSTILRLQRTVIILSLAIRKLKGWEELFERKVKILFTRRTRKWINFMISTRIRLILGPNKILSGTISRIRETTAL